VSHPTSSRSDGVTHPEPRSGTAPALSREAIDAVLVPALDEDGLAPRDRGVGAGGSSAPRGADGGSTGAGTAGPLPRRVDLASDCAIPEAALAQGRLVAKAEGVLCGLSVFARALEVCDPGVHVERLASDGERVTPGQEVLRAKGRARALLFAERTGLNFVQRLSGVATLTARYVERAGAARVLDTRKTTPNLRALEKYAVRCGGGVNHRFGLYDEAMVKNNHADLAGAALIDVLRKLRAELGGGVRITSEARDFAEACAGVDGDADVVLLDNFPVTELARSVPALRDRARGRARALELEASGGIHLGNVAEVAATGVDRISVGALTHSAPALDFSFYLRPA
jgi:nicotinate-nucleotide pyrophosphorylase (carboxylating)